MSARRPPLVGRYTVEELALAGRNRGMPLEALRHDVTPSGLHYLLIHFDIPPEPAGWKLHVSGFVDHPFDIDLDGLKALPSKTSRVTLECAGNGRGQLSPRYASVPWLEEGVSTAEWTGVPLALLLARAGLKSEAKDIVFRGADRGFDRGVEHEFARSLEPELARREEVLLAYAMNGEPLPPQHGAPLRLVVPGWYGMASVKWLYAIEAIDQKFDGLQQASGYHFRSAAGEKGAPCTRMRGGSPAITCRSDPFRSCMLRKKESISDIGVSAQPTLALLGSTVVSVTKRSNFLRSPAKRYASSGSIVFFAIASSSA